MDTLVLRDILLQYHGKTALRIDEFCANLPFSLIGCSGGGKSSFLKVLAGVEEIEKGEIYILGEECGDKKPQKRGISLISTQTNIFKNKTVYKNLSYPLKKLKKTRLQTKKAVTDCKQLFDSAIELNCNTSIIAEEFFNLNCGFDYFLAKKAKYLTKQEKTILILARALIKNPKILLIDEPSLIDVDVVLLVKLLKYIDCFYIFATFDFDLAQLATDRYVILRSGNIIFDGDYQMLKDSDDKYIKMMCFCHI